MTCNASTLLPNEVFILQFRPTFIQSGLNCQLVANSGTSNVGTHIAKVTPDLACPFVAKKNVCKIVQPLFFFLIVGPSSCSFCHGQPCKGNCWWLAPQFCKVFSFVAKFLCLCHCSEIAIPHFFAEAQVPSQDPSCFAEVVVFFFVLQSGACAHWIKWNGETESTIPCMFHMTLYACHQTWDNSVKWSRQRQWKRFLQHCTQYIFSLGAEQGDQNESANGHCSQAFNLSNRQAEKGGSKVQPSLRYSNFFKNAAKKEVRNLALNMSEDVKGKSRHMSADVSEENVKKNAQEHNNSISN